MNIRAVNGALPPPMTGPSSNRGLDVTISDQGVNPSSTVPGADAALVQDGVEPQAILSLEEGKALEQAFGSLDQRTGAVYNLRGKETDAANSGPGSLVDLVG